MTKPPKKLQNLIQAGQILSNIIYNLAQRENEKGIKTLYQESYKKWDDLLKNFRN